MAFDTPQDTTPTPQATPAPTVDPGDQSVAAAQPQPQSQSQAPSQPSGPATAPARIFPPSAQVHGVLGTLAMGALAATAAAANKSKGPLTKIAGKIGRGLGNFARNSPQGRQIQATRLAQQEGNQRMQLAQKQDQREDMKAMDEQTRDALETQHLNMQIIHDGIENQSSQMDLDDKVQAQNASLYGLYQEAFGSAVSDPKQIPVPNSDHPAAASIDPDKPTLTAEDAKTVGPNGTQAFLIPTGQSSAPVAVVNIDRKWAENTPVPKDFPIVTKWDIDPETGDPVAKETGTVRAGSESMWALHIQQADSTAKMKSARADFDAKQKSIKDAADAQKAKNDVDKEPKPDKIDPIAASIGGEPAKNAQGQWSFNGKLYPDQKSANAAYGNAYEDKKLVENKAGRPESYADVVVALHGTDRVDDATKVYTQAASANQSLQDAIKEGQDGNQVANSIATLGGALTITTSSGVHRINTTEVSQFAGANGVSWATQINQWLDRGAKGQVPPEIAQDWQNIAKMYQQNTYDAYVTHSQAIAANNGLNPAKVFVSTPDGKDEVPLSQAVAARHARAAQPQQPKVSTTRPPNVSPQATLMAVPGGQPTWIEPANMQAAQAAGAKAVTQ